MTRIPGEHAPNVKNRSSKHLICLTKHKSFYRSLSNEALYELQKNGDRWSAKELNRRSKKSEKRNKS